MQEMTPTVFVNTDMNNGAEEKELEKLYQELGKAYYEGGFEDPLPELLPIFDEITKYKKLEERNRLEKERQRESHNVQNEKGGFCYQCGTPINAGDKFCKKCGTQLM